MTTLVLGDIQGCYRELRELLTLADFNQQTDTLWLVGDLINRGPDNLQVMEFIMSLPSVRCVLGNHDLHFLAVAFGTREISGKDTFSDILDSPRCHDVMRWLIQQPLIHHDTGQHCVMVHAGLPPMWDLGTCLTRAAEVEAVLKGAHPERFFSEMYGNKPDHWDDQLSGTARLRLITNYFTRLRYCKRSGKLELKHKANLAPPGYSPWFRFERPSADCHQRILFGHWASIDGETGKDTALALDTGCVWGRSLTALRLDDGARFSVRSSMPLRLEE